jgi:hypothetical protein
MVITHKQKEPPGKGKLRLYRFLRRGIKRKV